MKTEEYRLKIADLERGRLPMSRLAEYLTDLASLLGYRDSVHFSHIEDGSTQIVATIDYQDVPKVKERLRSARQDDGSEEVDRAFYRLNRRLRTDNTSADLVTGDHTVIEFPGNKVRLDLEFGPFNEQASLIGVPIRIGEKMILCQYTFATWTEQFTSVWPGWRQPRESRSICSRRRYRRMVLVAGDARHLASGLWKSSQSRTLRWLGKILLSRRFSDCEKSNLHGVILTTLFENFKRFGKVEIER